MPCGLGHTKGLSTDPQTREFEQRIADEARVDQKHLEHALRDMEKEEKALHGAIKVTVYRWFVSVC